MSTGVLTAAAVVALVALAQDSPAPAIAAAVCVAAAASALSSPDLRAAVANFVVGAGVFGVVAILVANDGVPDGGGRLALLAVVAVPVAALVASAIVAATAVVRNQATEFERRLMTDAAALAFGAVALVALILTIADLVGGLDNPPPAVFAVACAVTFSLALRAQRRRMS